MTDVGGSQPGTARVWLRLNAQHRVAGLVVGIRALVPAGQGPAALLGVRDEAGGELRQVMLEVGQEAVVAGRRLRVVEIRPAERAAVHLSVLPGTSVPDPGAGAARSVLVLTLAVASLAVLALVAGGVAWTVWQVRMHREAPAMTSTAAAAGATRLTYQNRQLPPRPTRVNLGEGRQASLALGDVFTRDGVVTVRLSIGLADDQPSLVVREIPAGRSVTVGGVTVRVVAAYDLPSPAHDAADVVVSARF